MRRASVLLLLLLAGCGNTKPVVTQDVRIVERTELVPHIVFTTIPDISQTVVTLDTVSHLENDFAVSDAVIDRRGQLTHTLATKPQERPQMVEIPVVYRDSIVTLTQTVEVEVPAELNLWQRVRINSWWVLAVLVLLAYGKLIIKLILK
jgi:hypothetical protein